MHFLWEKPCECIGQSTSHNFATVDPVDFIFGRTLKGIDSYDVGGPKWGKNKSKMADGRHIGNT